MSGLLNLLGGLLSAIFSLIQQLLGLLSGLLNFLGGLLSAIFSLIQQLLGWLYGLFNQIMSLLQAIFDFLKSAGSFMVNVVENGAIIISAFLIITIGAFVYNRIR